MEELFGVDARVHTGDYEDTWVGPWFSVVAHQVGEGLVGWCIGLVALDERLDGGDWGSRHFGGGFGGLREEAGVCSSHEVLDGVL